MSTRERASELLRALAGPAARFRPNQLEGIEALVDGGKRVLLVQRTGWGKSAVYFIATKLLRDDGRGPTILVSPLLSLMRNQMQMAERVDIVAATINSSNTEDWPEVISDLDDDRVDLFLVSPERFSNQSFRNEVLPTLARHTGLLVIDEVHCISDWGHDFRPDYRRVSRIIELLPRGIPVLGATATANDRVIADVIEQLGTQLMVLRGPLGREGLRLHVESLPEPARRLAWLAQVVPTFNGSGIVYCLTKGDTHMVAQWLQQNGVSAVAYSGDTDGELRLQIEEDLLANQVKVVAATSALGMGFDKPDLAFVIHFQSPGSPIAYYQQVGRAGRALDSSIGVLLVGTEDEEIQDYFIKTAFPPEFMAEKVVNFLEAEARSVTTRGIEKAVNVRHSRLEQMLKILEVEGVVERTDGGYQRTLRPWRYPTERVAGVTAARRAEQEAMKVYTATSGCLMHHLRFELDDPQAAACGICMNCAPDQAVRVEIDRQLVVRANEFLRTRPIPIEARRRWPTGVVGRAGVIPLDVRPQQGRALSRWGDGGWGQLVQLGKYEDGVFSQELVEASARLIRRWSPDPAPTWITFVPSLSRPDLVSGFCRRLGVALGLPVHDAVEKVRENEPQKAMENSAQQFMNVSGRFRVRVPVDGGPVLLVDDVFDSKWTLTVIGVALREAGSGPVFPFTLAGATSA